MRRAREQLQLAAALVDGLLAEEPDSAEAGALKARCQMLAARLVSRRPEAGRPDGDRGERAGPEARQAAEAERSALQQSGLDLLRKVVQAHPKVESYRSEFVEAVLESTRRFEPGQGPRREPGGGEPFPRQPRPVTPSELTLLREARTHAVALHGAQPQEYRAQAGRALSRLGVRLVDATIGLDEAARAPLLAEAEAALTQATELERKLIEGGGPLEPRFVLPVVESAAALSGLYAATGRRDQAVAVLDSLLDLLEPYAERLDGGQLGPLGDVILRFAQPRLLQRWRALRDRLQGRRGR